MSKIYRVEFDGDYRLCLLQSQTNSSEGPPASGTSTIPSPAEIVHFSALAFFLARDRRGFRVPSSITKTLPLGYLIAKAQGFNH